MLEHLSEFDRTIAAQIADSFPEWTQFFDAQKCDGEAGLVVRIPSPAWDGPEQLQIDTFGGEVTVSLGGYHGHFDSFTDSLAKNALSLVRKLTSDEYCIVVYRRDDQWCGSQLMLLRDAPTGNDEMPYANRVLIKSWSGKTNTEIICVPKGEA